MRPLHAEAALDEDRPSFAVAAPVVAAIPALRPRLSPLLSLGASLRG
jgi:hypothetical protein